MPTFNITTGTKNDNGTVFIRGYVGIFGTEAKIEYHTGGKGGEFVKLHDITVEEAREHCRQLIDRFGVTIAPEQTATPSRRPSRRPSNSGWNRARRNGWSRDEWTAEKTIGE